MGKFFSILFVAFVLLNALGYYGLFLGLRYHNDVEMMGKLDLDNFDKSELVLVKIPIAIPYAMESEDFQRVDGMFEYNREFYRKVKQKFSRDTLHVICVKDKDRSYLHDAWQKYVKTFTNHQADGPPRSKAPHNFIKDYLVNDFSLLQASRGWEYEIAQTRVIFSVSEFFPSIKHPPKRMSL